MRFLLDENVDHRLIKPLSEAGHEVKVAQKGIKNSDLFLFAKNEGRILLTNDAEFLDTKKFPPNKTTGVIVLRVFPTAFKNQKEALLRLLGKYSEEEFFGKTIELNKDGEIFK